MEVSFKKGDIMTIKEKTLNVLENSRNEYISGAQLAKELGVSRNAVWKAIKSLQNEGYDINAVTNKGYCLSKDCDIMSAEGIRKYLSNNFYIDVYKKVTSTNIVAKDRASKGAKEKTVIVSEEQTQGRGRMGKTFYSPSQSGVYMSLILRPKISAQQCLNITTASAVAVARAVEDVCKAKAKIKWVNDVFCDNKKVCGILTEASFGLENGQMEYVVLGIGVNVKTPETGYPSELKDIATSIARNRQTSDIRNKLCAKILDYFWGYYLNLSNMEHFEEYRKRSILVGKDVNIIKGNISQQAKVLGIDDNCGLKVRLKDGTEKTLTAGEVSIKL